MKCLFSKQIFFKNIGGSLSYIVIDCGSYEFGIAAYYNNI